MIRAVRAIAVACSMALLCSACIGKTADVGSIIVDEITGVATVTGGSLKEAKALTKGEHIPVNATVHLEPSATIRLVRGDTKVDIRPYGDGAELTIAAIDLFEVSSGFALVRNDPSAPVGVSSRGIEARTVDKAVFRFDRQLGHERVGVYEGNVTVSSPSASELGIDAMRQGIVTARELPSTPDWYKYEPRDSWDSLLLGDVIRIDDELAARERGYRAQFGSKPKDVAELRALAPPGRNVYFVAGYLDKDSAELLVGTAMALFLEQSGTGKADELIGQLFTARDQGATWGELARSYGVEAGVVDLVVRAIELRTGERKPGTLLPPKPTPRTTGSGSPTPGQPTPTGSHSPRPSTSHSPSPTASPSKSTSPSPSPSASGSPLPTTPPTCIVLCS